MGGYWYCMIMMMHGVYELEVITVRKFHGWVTERKKVWLVS
jgi:hypothetical protein